MDDWKFVYAKDLCGVLRSLVQSPQSSIAKDKIQLKQHPRHPPARYSEAISNSETDSLDDWKFVHAKELCGVLRSLVQSPQSSIAKDRIQLNQYPRHPPARYSEAIPNSESDSLDDWKFAHAKELCGVLRSLVQSPQSLIAKDKIQHKQYPRHPPARYSEAISNSETDSLDDWKFVHAKELCGVLISLVQSLQSSIAKDKIQLKQYPRHPPARYSEAIPNSKTD